MQKFTGYWGYRLMLLFWIGICTSSLIFFGTTPIKHPDATGLIFVGLMLLMAGGMGLLALCGLVVSFTRYEIDERGVMRHGWNGMQQMYWSDVTRVETDGQHNSTLTLINSSNEKLTIERGFMDSKRAAELNVLLEPRLALVRERQLREIGSLKTVYYPKRNVTWAGGVMSLMVGAMLLFVAVQPVKPGQGWAMALCLLLIGGMELLFVYVTIVAYTDILTVTSSGLVEKDLFRTRTIAFADCMSILARTVQAKSDSWEVTDIRGRGTKITLSAKMNDYDLLVRYVRDRVNESAKQIGKTQAAELERKTDTQRRIMLPIFAGIYMIFLGGAGVMSLRDGNTRMQHYHLMDVQGRTAAGQITGKSVESGGKHTTYLLQYVFVDANGQRIESASPVAYADYSTAQGGIPVRVTYVPGRKDVCCIEQSIGRKQAEGKVRSGYIFLTLGIVLPVLLVLTALRKRRPEREASA